MATIEFGASAGKWSEAAKWVGGVKPGEGDDVVFSATSASCTITEEARCRSLNAELYKATLTQENTLRIGTTTSNAGVCLLLGAGMTLVVTSSAVKFVSTSGTKEKITTAGKVFKRFEFENGKYEQMDNATVKESWEWSNCEYITNDHEVIVSESGIMRCGGSTTEIKFGKSIVKSTSNGTFFWEFSNNYKAMVTTEATLEGTGSSLSYESSAAQTWKKLACTKGGMVFLSSAATIVTVETLEVNAGSGFTTNGIECEAGKAIAITKEIKVVGAKDANYVFFKSRSTTVWKLKLEAGVTFTPEFLEFERTKVEGAGTINEANHCFDWGGNEGITFKHNTIEAAAGAGKKWEETAAWTGAHLPTNSDDVVLGASSGSIETSPSSNVYARSLDATNYKATLTINTEFHLWGVTAPAGNLVFKLGAGMTLAGGNRINLRAKVSAPSEALKITTAGLEVPWEFFFEGKAKYELQDKFKYTGTGKRFVIREESELKTNNQEVIIGQWEQESSAKSELGSSVIVATTTSGTAFRFANTAAVTPGTSRLEITGTGEAEKTFENNSAKKFYDLVIASQNVSFNGSEKEAELHNLTFNTGGFKESIKLGTGYVLNVTNEFKHNAAVGSLVVFESREAAQKSSLKLAGAYSTDYLNIKGIKAEGVGLPYNAGFHSVDRGGNLNWVFPGERYGSIPATIGPSVY